jgi:ribosomal protein S18 acetylase RimI-like enzyme
MYQKLRKEANDICIRKYDADDFIPFCNLYSKIFSEAPWCETWTKKRVRIEVNEYLKQRDLNFLLAVLPHNSSERLIGFSVAYEVGSNYFTTRLATLLKSAQVPIIYGDELAVDGEFRNLGIGKRLMHMRFGAYTTRAIFVGRTDINSKMVLLYDSLGYTNTGVRDPEYNNRYYFIKRSQRVV